MNKPITNYIDDDAIDLIPEIISFFVCGQYCLITPMIIIAIIYAIHDCILIWNRESPEVNPCLIPSDENVEHLIDELESSTVDESVLEFFYNLAQAPHRHKKNTLDFTLDDEASDEDADKNESAQDNQGITNSTIKNLIKKGILRTSATYSSEPAANQEENSRGMSEQINSEDFRLSLNVSTIINSDTKIRDN